MKNITNEIECFLKIAKNNEELENIIMNELARLKSNNNKDLHEMLWGILKLVKDIQTSVKWVEKLAEINKQLEERCNIVWNPIELAPQNVLLLGIDEKENYYIFKLINNEVKLSVGYLDLKPKINKWTCLTIRPTPEG